MNTRMDPELTPFARKHGIGLINASPLHMGILTETGPPAWHPAPAEVKSAGAEIVRFCTSRGVRVSEIALQFSLAHPVVATTLAGMATVQQVAVNLKAASEPVDNELTQEIREIWGRAADRNWTTGLAENQDGG
jgi:L-galactose dehydrogenase